MTKKESLLCLFCNKEKPDLKCKSCKTEFHF